MVIVLQLREKLRGKSKNVKINFQSQEIVYSTENPISHTGGVVGLMETCS